MEGPPPTSSQQRQQAGQQAGSNGDAISECKPSTSTSTSTSTKKMKKTTSSSSSSSPSSSSPSGGATTSSSKKEKKSKKEKAALKEKEEEKEDKKEKTTNKKEKTSTAASNLTVTPTPPAAAVDGEDEEAEAEEEEAAAGRPVLSARGTSPGREPNGGTSLLRGGGLLPHLHEPEIIEVPIAAYDEEDHWSVVGCSGAPPAARSKHTAVHYNGSIYIFGGDDGNERLNDLFQFVIAKKEWRRVNTSGNPPKPRYYHSAVVEGPCMYVFGGYTDQNNNDTFQYHFGTQEWTQLECTGQVPSQRSGHNAVMYKGCMYVFGGYDGSKRLNDVFKLDIGKREWEAIETTGKAPTSRCNASALAAGDSMLIFAGHSGIATNSDLYEFNFVTRTWSQLECTGDAPSKRLGHTSVENQGHMYIFGGTAASTFSNDMYRLNILKKEWTMVKTTGQMPHARCYHTAVVVDRAMYIFGGSPPDAQELYQFTFAELDPPCTLSDDMAAFLEKREMCDVTFLVGKDAEPIPAHSLILRVRCQPLYDMVAEEQQRLNEGNNKRKRAKTKGKNKDTSMELSLTPSAPVEVALPDVSSAFIFNEMLYFVYTGEVRFTPKITLTQLFGLLSLAMNFKLERLIRLCERHIMSSVTLDNVIAVLKHVQHDKDVISARVKDFSITFVLRHYQDVIVQQTFETLEPALLVEIMRLYQQFTTSKSSKYQIAAAASKPVEIPPNKLPDDLARLRHDEKTWDFTFNVRGKPLGAHLPILWARTGFFQGALRSTMKGGDLHSRQMDVVIGTVRPTPRAFSSFLDYIYTGRVDIPADEAVYLLTASGYYGLTNDRLKTICSKQIIQKLNRDNLLRVLEAASDVGARQLKDFVLAEVVKDFVHVMHTQDEQVRQLPKGLLIDIMSALAFSMSRGGPSSPSSPSGSPSPFFSSVGSLASSSSAVSSSGSNSSSSAAHAVAAVGLDIPSSSTSSSSLPRS